MNDKRSTDPDGIPAELKNLLFNYLLDYDVEGIVNSLTSLRDGSPEHFSMAASSTVSLFPWKKVPLKDTLRVWALLPDKLSTEQGLLAKILDNMTSQLNTLPENEPVPMSVLSAWERIDGNELAKRSNVLPELKNALDSFVKTMGDRGFPIPRRANESPELDERLRVYSILEDFRKGTPIMPSMLRRLRLLNEKLDGPMKNDGPFRVKFLNIKRQKLWECLAAKDDTDAQFLADVLCDGFPDSEVLVSGEKKMTVAQMREAMGLEDLSLISVLRKGYIPQIENHPPHPPFKLSDIFNIQEPKKYSRKDYLKDMLPWLAVLFFVGIGAFLLDGMVGGMLRGAGLVLLIFAVVNGVIRFKWARQGHRD
ncbi:MAG: hypothetical protein LBQ80_05945 [Clostridium sp.]|jgi:hypothetical protein|nr:hypothetical protein [Clostridium sp.]